MPRSLPIATAVAHGGLSQSDSTTSFQRYEERVSAPALNIPRHMHRDPSSLRRSSSSKGSALPPLAHPNQPYNKDDNTSVRQPAFPILEHRPSRPGAEPGVNPTEESSIAEYSHFRQECVIDVIDYDSDDATFERLGNADFIKLMKDGYRKESNGDLDYHPKAIRWINIGGIDWDVLSSMALRYRKLVLLPTHERTDIIYSQDIHSLALEDVLHEQGDVQSKADYYSDHLFIRVLCHSVCSLDEHEDHVHPTDPEYHYHYGSRHRRRHEPGAAPPAYSSTTFDARVDYNDAFNEDTHGDLESGDTNARDNPRNGTSFSGPLNPQRQSLQRDNKRRHRLDLPFLRSSRLRTRPTGSSEWSKSVSASVILLHAQLNFFPSIHSANKSKSQSYEL